MDTDMFNQALREHGYAFQYATIAAIVRANEHQGTAWRFIAAEAPLELHGKDAHADLIFQNGSRYIVGECKRVNPAYSEWLFARSNYTTGSGPAPVLVEELFIERPSEYRAQVRPRQLAPAKDAYQVGVTVHTTKKGEGCVSDKTAISEAAKQVARASGGFTTLCVQNPELSGLRTNANVQVVPVIFTTAKLFICDVELEASELATGDVPPDAQFIPRSWLWFQIGLSHSMRAEVAGRFVAEHMPTWGAFFRHSAVRSLAIVNTEGIGEFLEHLDRG